VGVVPLAALALAARRERRGRQALGLPPPPPARRLPRTLGLAAVSILLGLAAAQPALRTHTTFRVRTDAEALFVIDVSRSMLAAAKPGAPARLERAKRDAIAIRDGIADVPSGVATLTDRVLPSLLPNADPSVFRNTVQSAVEIEQPPPSSTDVVATTLGALGAVGTQNFFAPTAKRRLVVVLTDGESRPFDQRQVARALGAGRGTRLIVVRVGAPGESVYTEGRAEPAYRSDSGSARQLASLAAATGGAVFDERSTGSASRAARAALGTGPTRVVGATTRTTSLAPYVLLLSLVPLLALVWPGLIRGLDTLVHFESRTIDRRPVRPARRRPAWRPQTPRGPAPPPPGPST